MLRLCILADDFTGALDTGVQFAKAGVKTLVINEWEDGFPEYADGYQVVAVNMDTRQKPPREAYEAARLACRHALSLGAEFIYKKTDSALRGNIGAELSAVLKETHAQQLCFVPAFPKLNRITDGGVHYIGDAKVKDSVFGQDPFTPVLHSRVSEIIAAQSGIKTHELKPGDAIGDMGILIYDAACDADIERIAHSLKAAGKLTAMAGCAGFAAFLPDVLGLNREPLHKLAKGEQMLIVSGSVNEITLNQLMHAEAKYPLFSFDSRMRRELRHFHEQNQGFAKTIKQAIKSNRVIMVSSSLNSLDVEDSREYAQKHGLKLWEMAARIADNMGDLVAQVYAIGGVDVLAVFGGDTLMAVMEALGCGGVVPLQEVAPGVVISRPGRDVGIKLLVTKSGGFGDEDIVEEIVAACL